MVDGNAKEVQNQGHAGDENAAIDQEAVLFDEITVLERGLSEAEMALAEDIMVNWNSF